jgi:hypothetical protein
MMGYDAAHYHKNTKDCRRWTAFRGLLTLITNFYLPL